MIHPRTFNRFMKHVIMDGDKECWLWKGAHAKEGYGRLKFSGADYRASRFMYKEIMRRHIPLGYEVHHLCNNPPCVNPNHLFAVTPSMNSHARAILRKV